MIRINFFFIPAVSLSLIFIPACSDKQINESSKSLYTEDPYDTVYTVNTSGFMDNGELYTKWDCPDSKFFPPIDIKSWNKTSVVNGRLPTYKETLNGTSILFYGGKINPKVKPYNMVLPKLAFYMNGPSEFVLDSNTRKIIPNIKKTKPQPELVVVIQIVQTAKDTIVGYRYLTGGVGGSLFSNFHFLTDEEVEKIVGINNKIIPIRRGISCNDLREVSSVSSRPCF